MFTWICPQCGREVPPAYSECPDCAGKTNAPAVEPAQTAAAPPPPPRAAAPAPPPPQQAPPPDRSPQAQPQAPYAPQVQYVYAKRGLPAWLVTLLVAGGSVGIGAGLYYFVSHRGERAASTESAPVPFERPRAAGKGDARNEKGHRFARYVEAAGIRVIEEGRKPQVRILIVNHSAADLAGLSGNVTLRSSAAKADAPPVAEFPFSIASLGAYESKEVTAPLKTSLRAYEMPDWQFLKADVELTAP